MDSKSALSLHPRTLMSVLRYALVLGAVLLILYSIPRVYHLLSMTIVALLISYLLNPPVTFLEQYKLTRGASTTIVFVVIGLLATWGIFEISPFLWEQYEALRAFLANNKPNSILENYLRQLERSFGFLPKGSLAGQVGVAYDWVFGQLSGIPQVLYLTLQYLIIVPFIAFFLTRDRRRIRRFVVQSVPNQFFEMMFDLYYKVDKKLGAYIRGITIESFIIAVLSIIGLWIVDVKYMFVIGIFAGVANVIPYFGPVAGAIPALVVKFLDHNDPYTLIPVAAVFLIIQLVDNVFLKPIVVAKTMDLHPLIVLIVVVAGGELWGILGMIVSIPIASMFVVILTEMNWALNNYSFKR
ncbi:MAG: AI-2E family transporter [bacterium]